MSFVQKTVQRMGRTEWFGKVGPKIVPRLDKFAFRVSGGRYMISNGMLPALLLTATGAKSGEPRSVPLAFMKHERGPVLVASNFGRKNHPAWSYNLLANPEATMARGGKTTKVKAVRASDEEKAELWPRLTKQWPAFDTYVERSQRNIRVFFLEPSD